jgi:hypothetical protein
LLLNLYNHLDKEKAKFLDFPVEPKDLFGVTVAILQKCEL